MGGKRGKRRGREEYWVGTPRKESMWVLSRKSFGGGWEILQEIPKEDLNRIFRSFACVSFQGPGLH